MRINEDFLDSTERIEDVIVNDEHVETDIVNPKKYDVCMSLMLSNTNIFFKRKKAIETILVRYADDYQIDVLDAATAREYQEIIELRNIDIQNIQNSSARYVLIQFSAPKATVDFCIRFYYAIYFACNEMSDCICADLYGADTNMYTKQRIYTKTLWVNNFYFKQINNQSKDFLAHNLRIVALLLIKPDTSVQRATTTTLVFLSFCRPNNSMLTPNSVTQMLEEWSEKFRSDAL